MRIGRGIVLGCAVAMLALAGCASSAGRGAAVETGRSLDFAIDGEGFFVVETGQGGYLFTRKGAIFLAADAYLVNADGYRIAPAMQLAIDAHVIQVEPDGRVSYKRDGDLGAAVIGYIKLARFDDPSKLRRDGDYFLPTAGSGEPTTHRPGTGGVGKLRAGALESR